MSGKIIATGIHAPTRIMTNDEISQFVDTSDEWIVERTGIKERRIAADGETTSDLCVSAAEQALSRAQLDAQSIDFIICATNTPDFHFPATAALVQEKMKIAQCGGFDLQAGCTSFVYGLEIASKLVGSNGIRKVLVLGAEVLSRFLNWEDRTTCVLFGDGAGAAIIGESEDDTGIQASYLGSDGSLSDTIIIPAGGSQRPINKDEIDGSNHLIHMNGRAVYKWAIRIVIQCIEKAVQMAGWTLDDLDWVVPHQANNRITQAVARDMGLPESRFISNIHRYGNTSAASIPLVLHEALVEGKIKPGEKIVTVGFGAGLTYGSNAIQF